MKKLVLLFVVLLCALQGNAQLLRSSTLIETSVFAVTPDFVNPNYLDHTNIDQTIYWRRRYNGDSQEKTVYNFHSIFKRDSIIGVRVYGIDVDMMTDVFEKQGANSFRYWNKLRMGFTLILQKNPKLPDYPSDQFYNYINGEMYLSYLHLLRGARGDRMTKSRRGSFMAFFLITPTFRIDIHCKINLGSVWMKGYYNQEYGNIWEKEYWSSINRPRVGLCAEWETNPRGYDKTKVHSSKDLYRGFTLVFGPEYDLHTKEISLRVGMKWDLRNHWHRLFSKSIITSLYSCLLFLKSPV